MPNSKNLDFSFLEAAQAQKHLTVNDALFRLDALHSIVYVGEDGLPVAPQDGGCYVEPIRGEIAIASGGGYLFISPRIGMKAITRDGVRYTFNGTDWREESSHNIIEFLIDLSDSDSQKAAIFPEKCPILGVTARVVEDIFGDNISSWAIGVTDDLYRYGSGYWLGQNGWACGLTGTPMTYWQDTQLVISPDQGRFSAGKIRVYIHLHKLPLPPEV